jgi:hypothetical protein
VLCGGLSSWALRIITAGIGGCRVPARGKYSPRAEVGLASYPDSAQLLGGIAKGRLLYAIHELSLSSLTSNYGGKWCMIVAAQNSPDAKDVYS